MKLLTANLSPTHPHEFSFESSQQSAVLRQVLKHLTVSVITGPNGSGKTSALSRIASAIHHVDWKHERLPRPVRLQYELAGKRHTLDVPLNGLPTVRTSDGDVWAIKDAARRRASADPGILAVVPRLITSIFSTRGEYPPRRVVNARGTDHSFVYDIKELYGKNHYGIGSLSTGLRRLLTPPTHPALSSIRSVTDLTLRPHVKVYPTNKLRMQALQYASSRAERSALQSRAIELDDMVWAPVTALLPWATNGWIPVDDNVLRAAKDDQVYLNDIQIETSWGPSSLMTISAGQKMLLVRLLTILSSIENGALVIIEEPELHLDPIWCGGFVELLGSFFGDYQAHVILSTQSPAILRCFPRTSITVMPLHGVQTSRQTMLASESVVVDSLFRAGSAIGRVDQLALESLNGLSDAEKRTELEMWGDGPARAVASVGRLSE